MAQHQVAPRMTLADTPSAEEGREKEDKAPEVAAGTAVTSGALVAYDFGEDADSGYESIGKDEQLTPFLLILQALSPQCDQTSPVYQADARPGLLLNNATGQLYPGDTGVEFLACWNEHVTTKWIPRDMGGGFRGISRPDDPDVLDARRGADGREGRWFGRRPVMTQDGEDGRPEDVELVDQYNVGILYAYPNFAESDSVSRALLAFTSTKIPVFRAWISSLMDIKYRHPVTGVPTRPPTYAHRLRLTSVPQKNKKGSFYNYRIRLAEMPPHAALLRPDDPLYLQAKEFARMYTEKEIKVDYRETAGDVQQDDDVPF